MGRNFGIRERRECHRRRRPPLKARLGWLQLGVAFDEFFWAAAGEADGEAAVVFITFDVDDGADSVFGMADFAAEHGIGWCAAGSRTTEAGRFRALTRRGRTLWGGATAYAAHKFFGGVRIFRVGFVAAGVGGFGPKAARGGPPAGWGFLGEKRGGAGGGGVVVF